MTPPLLSVRDLDVRYGTTHAVQDASLQLDEGQVVAVLGSSGAGKTSLVHGIVGIVKPDAGSVLFDGAEIARSPAHVVAARGIALVPQGRRVFGPLSVAENLRVPRARRGEWTLPRVYEEFPMLAERPRQRARDLSGGQQQMLAIARALVTNPRVLVMDEPSEGLAPRALVELGDLLARLKRTRTAILLVEQNVGLALELADAVYVMEAGRVVAGREAPAAGAGLS